MWHERRKHHRRFHDYLLEIEGELRSGQIFQEMVAVVNISAGGAQFTTLYKERYYVGQPLQASIFLSGRQEVTGHMKTLAHVLRINENNECSPPDRLAQANITITFTEPFDLIR